MLYINHCTAKPALAYPEESNSIVGPVQEYREDGISDSPGGSNFTISLSIYNDFFFYL